MNRWTFRLALVVLVGSFVMPLSGLGVDLCPIHRATHLPCPGCGMTRAIAMISQGEFGLALGANPFVIFAWPVLLVLAVLAVMPGPLVTRVEQGLDSLEPASTRVQHVILFAFLGFGVARFVALLAMGETFP